MDTFTKGLYRNPASGSILDTENYTGRDSLGNVISGGLSAENLAGQGYSRLNSSLVNGGQLFSDGSGYEQFVQRPKGWTPQPETPSSAPGQVVFANPNNGSSVFVDPNDHNQMRSLASKGYQTEYSGYMPDNIPNTISSGNVYQEGNAGNADIQQWRDMLTVEQQNLKAQTDSLMEEIRADYEANRKSMQERQVSDKATDQAIQFKLGQSGTAYGTSQLKKNDLKRAQELDSLLSEKQSLLSKATRAYNDDNIKLMKEYTKQINELDEKYYQRQRDQRKDQINEYVRLGQEDREERKFAFDQDKFFIGEERMARTQELSEARFNYEVSNDMEDKALENIKRMATSRIDITSLTPEEIRQMEYEAGLLPGTFEAFYDGMLQETLYGDEMDRLKMDQLKAQIARTYQLASGAGSGGGMASEGFANLKTEQKFRTASEGTMFALQEGQIDADRAFRELRLLANPSEVSDQAIVDYISQALGIGPAGSEAVEDVVGEEPSPYNVLPGNSAGAKTGAVIRELPGAAVDVGRGGLSAAGAVFSFLDDFIGGVAGTGSIRSGFKK